MTKTNVPYWKRAMKYMTYKRDFNKNEKVIIVLGTASIISIACEHLRYREVVLEELE